MLTLGFVETVETIQLRDQVAKQIIERAKKAKPSVRFSLTDARRLAYGGIILAHEAGRQAADEMRAEIEERIVQTGTSSVGPLLVASAGLGLATLVAIVGLWES